MIDQDERLAERTEEKRKGEQSSRAEKRRGSQEEQREDSAMRNIEFSL